MPSTYTGNTTGITARQNVTISEPVGTDVRSSASVRTPLETLANFLQYVCQKAGLIDTASTWTAKQTMSGGVGGLPAPAEDADAATKAYADTSVAAQIVARTITTPTLEANWTQSAGDLALRYFKGSDGIVHLFGRASGGAGSALVFTLPAGHRPLAGRKFQVVDDTTGAAAQCVIGQFSDGSVSIGGFVSGRTYYFDGVTFLAEQ
jgi:hypothetical protein